MGLDFEGELDGELREILLRGAHSGHVFVKLVEPHAPVVEVIPAHGGVIGEADFREAGGERLGGVLGGRAGGVPAQRRVHVVICGPTHGGI